MKERTQKRKEQARVRKQRQRDKERDIGERDINSVTGLTRIEFIKEALRIKDKDGKVLNEHLIDGIEAASLRFNDREARYEKAYRYNQWRSGKEIAPAVPFALVYNREGMEKIYQSLNSFKVADKVSYGCGHQIVSNGGMPFDMVGEYLDATVKGV